MVWVVIVIAVVSLSGLVFISKRTHAPSVVVIKNLNTSQQKLPDLAVTYELSEGSKRMYSIVVSSSIVDGQVVLVNAKACNTMNSTITILPKGKSTDKKVIKTLKDGRQVLEPMTISTLIACESTTPQTDDMALNRIINSLAASIQSY